jgi:hypothetical protein
MQEFPPPNQPRPERPVPDNLQSLHAVMAITPLDVRVDRIITDFIPQELNVPFSVGQTVAALGKEAQQKVQTAAVLLHLRPVSMDAKMVAIAQETDKATLQKRLEQAQKDRAAIIQAFPGVEKNLKVFREWEAEVAALRKKIEDADEQRSADDISRLRTLERQAPSAQYAPIIQQLADQERVIAATEAALTKEPTSGPMVPDRIQEPIVSADDELLYRFTFSAGELQPEEMKAIQGRFWRFRERYIKHIPVWENLVNQNERLMGQPPYKSRAAELLKNSDWAREQIRIARDPSGILSSSLDEPGENQGISEFLQIVQIFDARDAIIDIASIRNSPRGTALTRIALALFGDRILTVHPELKPLLETSPEEPTSRTAEPMGPAEPPQIVPDRETRNEPQGDDHPFTQFLHTLGIQGDAQTRLINEIYGGERGVDGVRTIIRDTLTHANAPVSDIETRVNALSDEVYTLAMVTLRQQNEESYSHRNEANFARRNRDRSELLRDLKDQPERIFDGLVTGEIDTGDITRLVGFEPAVHGPTLSPTESWTLTMRGIDDIQQFVSTLPSHCTAQDARNRMIQFQVAFRVNSTRWKTGLSNQQCTQILATALETVANIRSDADLQERVNRAVTAFGHHVVDQIAP